jgi:alpha-L-rhamnosidase
MTILPPIPVITSAASITGTNGSAFTYQITATNSPSSFAAANLPTGLSVNTSSGLISGTPTVSGTFPATISATYLTQTGTAPLGITIIAVPPGTPAGFQAIAQWNNGTPYAALQWSPGPGGTPDGYTLDRRLTGIGSFQHLTSIYGAAGATGFNDFWVQPATSYDYRITAFNTSGTAAAVTTTFLVPQPVPLGYPAWSTSLANPLWSATGPDGLPNSLRYAFTGNPALGGAPGALLLKYATANSLTLWGRTFASRKDTHYQLQGSPNLATWQSYLDETSAQFPQVGTAPGSTAPLLTISPGPAAPKFFRWSVSPNTSAAVPPAGMSVNGLSGSSGALLTQKTPDFSWGAGNDSQTAYEIILATSPSALASGTGLLWDSGEITGSNSLGITLPASITLANNTTYYWTVRTWDSAGDVSTYAPSQTFTTGILTSTYQTDLPRLLKIPVSPVSIIQKGPGWYFIDFDRDAFSNLGITIPNPVNGQSVTVGMGEMLSNSDTVDTTPLGDIRYQADTFTMATGSTSYLVIPTRSGGGITQPAYTGQVFPFRYVEITGVPDPFTASQITQYAVHVPFDDTAASFTCSDSLINSIWALCKYTTYATIFCGPFVDGDRERTPYESDDYIHGLNAYCIDRDYATARFSLEYFYNPSHTTWPTEWWSTIPMFAWKEYLYTGDPRSMRTNYALLQPKLLPLGVRADGLYVTGSYPALTDIVDWPDGERDGYDMSPPIKTVVTSFQAESEICMQQIASALYTLTGSANFLTDANTAASISGSTTASLNADLWSTANNTYVDAMSTANVPDTHVSVHGNFVPYAMGLVPLARQPAVIAYLKTRGLVCGVYGAQYLFEALYLGGEGTYAQSLLDSTGLRSWYNMIKVGTTITSEAWDYSLKTNEDWNHAWGSAACNIIGRFLMGIRPLQPGWSKLLIQPQPGTLAWASMTMPTILGPVTVQVQANTPSEFDMSINVPPNTTALVSVPTLGGTDTTVTLDGTPVTGTGPGGTITPDWAFTEKPAMVSSTGLVTGSTIFLDNIPPGPHLLERVP